MTDDSVPGSLTLVAGDRLVWFDENARPADNGIYVVTKIGTWPAAKSAIASSTRAEKSKYGRAPRQVRQDRNSKAREKILAKATR